MESTMKVRTAIKNAKKLNAKLAGKPANEILKYCSKLGNTSYSREYPGVHIILSYIYVGRERKIAGVTLQVKSWASRRGLLIKVHEI